MRTWTPPPPPSATTTPLPPLPSLIPPMHLPRPSPPMPVATSAALPQPPPPPPPPRSPGRSCRRSPSWLDYDDAPPDVDSTSDDSAAEAEKALALLKRNAVASAAWKKRGWAGDHMSADRLDCMTD
jgi:hypothetical protein